MFLITHIQEVPEVCFIYCRVGTYQQQSVVVIGKQDIYGLEF